MAEGLKHHVKEFGSGLETRVWHGDETVWRGLDVAMCAVSTYRGFSKLSINISVPHWVLARKARYLVTQTYLMQSLLFTEKSFPKLSV